MRVTMAWRVSALFFVLAVVGCSDAPVESVADPRARQTPGAGSPAPPALKSAKKALHGVQPDRQAGQQRTAEKVQASEHVQAKTGVGQKGRRLEDERLAQTIVTPAISLFRTRERMVFEVKIPHAMQLYEAMNGRKPQSQKEFFDQIIKANQIQLPELQPGHQYVYDPEKGQLMVERPAQ